MAGERILVVDDEPGVRMALEAILSDEGYRVVSAESGEEGLEALRRESFDAVFLDEGRLAVSALTDVGSDAGLHESV